MVVLYSSLRSFFAAIVQVDHLDRGLYDDAVGSLARNLLHAGNETFIKEAARRVLVHWLAGREMAGELRRMIPAASLSSLVMKCFSESSADGSKHVLLAT